MLDTWQIGFFQPEAGADRRAVEQAQHPVHAEALLRQPQQRQKHLRQRRSGGFAAVGNRIRNRRRAGVRRKHGVDEGRIQFDIRRQHHHVRRLQAIAHIKQGQQLVVQHLNLAHRAVANMHLQRAIISSHRVRLAGGPVGQRQYILLQASQQAMRHLRLVEHIMQLRHIGQAIEKIPALFAPRSQQGVANIQIQVGRIAVAA